jgi:phage virion morphogenesis family|nr:MAG TPA: tail morphogenesis protein [Caudoviricetes sp.]
MTPKDFLTQTLTDIKVKLGEEFDRNFERKAFFDEKWPATKLTYHRGSLMMRTGRLRKSLLSPKVTSNGIIWSSSLPYADIHNNGGEIRVTPQMRKFFWAKYYQTSSATTKKKNGEASSSARNKKLSIEAEQWKALALKPIGSIIKIEKRQFIGSHPQVDKHIKEVINHNFGELKKEMDALMKNMEKKNNLR